jgi:hypothetical protein
MSATGRYYKPEEERRMKNKNEQREIWSENRLKENKGIKSENIFHACI